MVNTAEKILKKKAVYKVEMDKIMPRKQRKKLWKKAALKLDSIMNQYGTLPRGVQMHTSRIFPAAAIYLTAKDVVGEEKAYHIIEDAAACGCERIAGKLQKLMTVPGMRSLFVAAWDPMTKKMFGERSGFQNRFYPKKKGEYRMDIIFCPYNRYFTELGCPELTKIFCENDERTYGNLPGLIFERKGTLGKGAVCCDFYIRKSESFQTGIHCHKAQAGGLTDHIQLNELPYCKPVKKWLIDRYGKEANQIWKKTARNYNEYLSEIPDYGGKKNGHARAIYGGRLIRCGTCGNSAKCDYLIVGNRNELAAEYETVTDAQGFLISRKRKDDKSKSDRICSSSKDFSFTTASFEKSFSETTVQRG